MASTPDSRAARTSGKWLSLVAASAGIFLALLDITVNVALTDISASFGTDLQTVQWIIIFYVGTSTGLHLSLGSAADIYGLKRFYVVGLAVYSLAVLLIGLVPELAAVLGLRVFQAVGAGLIMVSAPALVTKAFPTRERGKALGLMTAIGTLGMIAGSLAGGVLVDSFGWRAIFIARVPIGVIAIILALSMLREESSRSRRERFDFPGATTIFVGFAALILLLALGGRSGWTQLTVLLLASLSVVFLGAFGYFEATSRRPVLDLGLVRHRVLTPVLVVAFLMFMGIFANWFILPFYVSDVLEGDAETMGMLLALLAAVGAASAPIGGWISDRVSPAYVVTLGLAISASAMFWFASLSTDSTVLDIALRMGAAGAGTGLFQAANAALIMGSVPSDRLGTGGALLELSRSMGVVSSVAILSALFASRLDSHTLSLAQQGIGGSPGDAQAFVMAFKDIYGVSALLAGAAALVSLTYWPQLLRRGKVVKRGNRISG